MKFRSINIQTAGLIGIQWMDAYSLVEPNTSCCSNHNPAQVKNSKAPVGQRHYVGMGTKRAAEARSGGRRLRLHCQLVLSTSPFMQ